MNKCIVCGKPVEWKIIIDVFKDIFDRVDYYGEDSLTEIEQIIYHGKVCSEDCFFNLD